ncbi:MAG TPA: hypothetical protein VFE57_12230, partial [Cyclobacteriaceae bacterium]|nr:hypothetical protein [Cyclobacteriaceae bacterium]
MKRIITIFFICMMTIFVSCEESVTPNPPTFYKIITGNNKKTWKLTALKWTGEGQDDIKYTLGNCYKDDLYIFYANTEKLYEVTGGTIKCSSDETATLVSDTWSMVNATATLTVVIPIFSDNPLPFFVQKVTSKEMTLQIYLDQDNKYSYVVTMQSV